MEMMDIIGGYMFFLNSSFEVEFSGLKSGQKK